jgi:hypothetical protein
MRLMSSIQGRFPFPLGIVSPHLLVSGRGPFPKVLPRSPISVLTKNLLGFCGLTLSRPGRGDRRIDIPSAQARRNAASQGEALLARRGLCNTVSGPPLIGDRRLGSRRGHFCPISQLQPLKDPVYFSPLFFVIITPLTSSLVRVIPQPN